MILYYVDRFLYALLLLSVIIFIEIIFNFKRVTLLKIFLLSEVLCIGFICAGNIYCLNHPFNRWLIDFPTSILAILALFTYTVLYEHRLNRSVFIFGITVIFANIALYVVSSSIFGLSSDVNLIESKDLRYTIFASRTLIHCYFIYQMYKLYKKINSKYQSQNIYYQKIKNWSIFGVLSCFLLLPNRILKVLNITDNTVYILSFSIAFLFILLFILFRPRFINRASLEIILSKAFNKEGQSKCTIADFEFQFYTKCFYLKIKTTLEEFGKEINLSPDLINKFVFQNYSTNFNDLVNKARVDYFVALVYDGKHTNFTIEGLAKLSGFGSRQNLYAQFKKFHGGNPSELMNSIGNKNRSTLPNIR